ncbi:MAG TPA: fasciclin domain-containing protein [Allosphingosinicella sp.]|nr:fasciclin domain-containing protein [Allosphingosinicella sp.]
MAVPPTLKAMALAAAAALAACGEAGQDGNEAAPANQAAAAPATGAGAGAAGTAAASGAQMLPDKSIGENLAASPDHSSFVAAVKAAGLAETLTGPTPYTLFAPVNSAFQKLPAGTMDNLLKPEGKGQLTALITYHAVPGVVAAADLARAVDSAGGTAELATLGGTNLKVSKAGDALIVTDGKGGQARVTQADMVQSNGVVHVIDAVLMPN